MIRVRSTAIYQPSGRITPEYTAWSNMRRRCSVGVEHRDYAIYGAKGIAVCERWQRSFYHFLEDMGPRPSALHSLDRYPDNRGNYEPGNVRWATRLQQNRNKTTNIKLEISGIRMCISAWAEVSGLDTTVIEYRVKRGWPARLAVFTQPQHFQYNKGRGLQPQI